MAQNIIAAYLTGARFFELKTVQIMDNLEIAKPCIAAQCEGYNTEWSTELSVPQAFDEYLKAWLLIPFVRQLISQRFDAKNDPLIFNMSVGYNLAGIQSPKIDRFIENLKVADSTPAFTEYRALLVQKMGSESDSITFHPISAILYAFDDARLPRMKSKPSPVTCSPKSICIPMSN
jgi:putative selenate reductase